MNKIQMNKNSKQVELSNRLNSASNVKDVFSLVKSMVMDTFAIKKDKLVIASGDLEASGNFVLGGFYSHNDNAIVLNKKILDSIKRKNPEIFNSYLFHVLLHEYLHSIGFIDEIETRKLAFLISNKHLGFSHDATKIALNPGAYLKSFIPYQQKEIYFDKLLEDNDEAEDDNDEEIEEDDDSITDYIG
ncbi:MAG: hypothetical protein AABW41_04855 [Nanoarchaeota archaeon]